MENFASFAIFIFVALFVGIVKKGERAKKAQDAQPSAPRTSEETSSLRTVRAQKRESMARAEQWRAAKRQQDDAEQVHSIHMDSCESRLESLRVLYDAGILDREEYASRVARVHSQHNKA